MYFTVFVLKILLFLGNGMPSILFLEYYTFSTIWYLWYSDDYQGFTAYVLLCTCSVKMTWVTNPFEYEKCNVM